ncbi:S-NORCOCLAURINE SYNTHASE 1-LIKE [Salix koriyanagi]|uniref:S-NORCOCLAURINE SYNTHASE 1-LIKE n=1 Tax=Salix koriyanagi TaxID=2511006 RepID=A0A9Q1AIX4_9ROSI|nr:S-NORCOCLAURINE SYNTHASE 1-LIKE [Salix koriyanagi]
MDPNVENGGMQGDEVLGWGKSLSVPSVQEMSNGDEDERKKLHIACKEWGFFQITNHDVSEEVIKQMKAAVAAFFELPLGREKKVCNGGQRYSWKMKFWPVLVPGFKEAVEQYLTEILKLAEEIFANISLLMGMDRDDLKRLHGEMMKQGLRMNYYPNCSMPELVLGDDDITGLQIRHLEEWVPVKPIPNAIVMNIGDVIEGWSNGVYKSIEHRAVTECDSGKNVHCNICDSG